MTCRRKITLRHQGQAVALLAAFAVIATLSCTGDSVDDDSVYQEQSSRLGSFNVLTRNYSNQRTGANLSETTLNTLNVNTTQFGKLFQLPVDDQVYAGVLYASGVSIAGGTHNVVYVATTNNTVYAFDADAAGSPLWQKNFNGSGRPSHNTELGQGACGANQYHDFVGLNGAQADIGIVGTPVIDGAAGTIYFVTRVVTSTTTQQLHALDITTGNERSGSPKTIAASVAGNGSGGSQVTFNPVLNNQRPALALSQGIVYIAWSSFCDDGAYRGWTMGYDGTTLNQVGAMSTAPNGTQAGIWMGGAGPVVDSAGAIYLATGNGSSDGNTNFGESLLKLTPGSLARSSFFTAFNFVSLNNADNDLGSCGPIMLPGISTSIVTGSKEGKIYLMSTSNLGGVGINSDNQITQWFQAVNTTVVNSTHHIHNSPVAWQSPAGVNLYVWGENDFLRGYRFNSATGKFTTPQFATGSKLPPLGMPGGMMTVSANGSSAGSGILWATTPSSGDANHATVPGVLRAFNAENLALLWESTSAADNTQTFAKFNPPVVAAGKVYVPSFSNLVSVYGLRAAPTESPFSTLNIPGTVEAEFYDNGGEGIAYHDADAANQGGAFRPAEGVDVQTASEGGFNVGWTTAGEWMKYTVNIAQAGTYNLSGRYASGLAGGGALRLEVDGSDATGSIPLASTGNSWTQWTNIPTKAISLPSGQHILRVFVVTAGFNLNNLTFTLVGQPPPYTGTPFGGTRASVPGVIQAENFDEGGEGVAYHDTDAVNMGTTTTRAAGSPGVDLQPTTDTGGGVNVGWIDTGEWLRYSVNVTAAGTYTVTFRVASGATAAGAVRLEVDGTDVTGTQTVNPTGGWQTWTNVSKAGVTLTAGNHLLRVFTVTTGFNLNSVTIQ